MSDTEVSDRGLVHLQTLSCLKVLRISTTYWAEKGTVTDAGLEILAEMASLTSLWLHGQNSRLRKITAEGLAVLSKLDGLAFLDVGGSIGRDPQGSNGIVQS